MKGLRKILHVLWIAKKTNESLFDYFYNSALHLLNHFYPE